MMRLNSGFVAARNFELRRAITGIFLFVLASTVAWAQTVDPAKLMAPSPLPERALGDDKAPVICHRVCFLDVPPLR